MTADYWRKKIRKHTEAAGTYQKYFDNTIETLALILAERDRVYQQYVEEGAHAVVIRVSDRGAVNSAKNPLLLLWAELNRDALTYWRDLGLTPAGLKRINDAAMQVKGKDSPLEAVLKSFGSA